MCQTEPVSEWSESWVSNVTFYYWIRNWLVFFNYRGFEEEITVVLCSRRWLDLSGSALRFLFDD